MREHQMIESSIHVKVDNKIVQMATGDDFDFDIYILQRYVKGDRAIILFKHTYSDYQLYVFNRESFIVRELYTFDKEEEAQLKYKEVLEKVEKNE